MIYYEIKEKLAPLVVFTVEDLLVIDPGFRMETLYEWEKKGLVTKLRNKRYAFGDATPTNTDLYLIANKLYSASYISLELALNHYGVIPEAVLRITSVTTNKTLSVKTKFGIFDYSSISQSLFFGYVLKTTNGVTYKIASVEKALVDYLYLHPEITTMSDFEELRFNKEQLRDSVDMIKLNDIVKVFNNKALSQRVNNLIDYIK